MRLIAPLARALVITLLALACGYLVRVFAAHGQALGPPPTPPPSSLPAAASTLAAAPTPVPVLVSPMPASRADSPTPQPVVSVAPAPAVAVPSGAAMPTVAPAPGVPLPTSLPPYAVKALPAPPVSLATAQPAIVVAEQPAPVMAAPHDPPQILDVHLSTQEIRGGETVYGQVRTSSNVASVEARVEGYSSSLPKVGVGEFAIAYKVPPVIPFYLQHSYSLHLIARNVDGAQATRDLPVSLR